MSTADGLVVSTSQIFANDLYRRTIAPRQQPPPSEAQVERRALSVSRWGTLVSLAAATGLAWALLDKNVALLVWIGVGGMMAALTGPLLLGVLWKGVTRNGALAGFAVGAVVFSVTHAPAQFPGLVPNFVAETSVGAWLLSEASNPYSCAALGQFASLLATVLVSKLSRSLPAEHIEDVFGSS